MAKNKPTSQNWNVRLTREVENWSFVFTEHWTYKVRDGEVNYKLRIVGPNGEVAREEMPPESVPHDVRAAFVDTFEGAVADA